MCKRCTVQDTYRTHTIRPFDTASCVVHSARDFVARAATTGTVRDEWRTTTSSTAWCDRVGIPSGLATKPQMAGSSSETRVVPASATLLKPRRITLSVGLSTCFDVWNMCFRHRRSSATPLVATVRRAKRANHAGGDSRKLSSAPLSTFALAEGLDSIPWNLC